MQNTSSGVSDLVDLGSRVLGLVDPVGTPGSGISGLVDPGVSSIRAAQVVCSGGRGAGHGRKKAGGKKPPKAVKRVSGERKGGRNGGPMLPGCGLPGLKRGGQK
jgi:hypothetical protein